MCVYNDIVYDYIGTADSSGIILNISGGNSSSVYENNTVYGCVEGFEFNSNDGSAKNNASFENSSKDYDNSGTLTIFSQCASSDTTGSEDNLKSLVDIEQFESIVSTEENFLYPVLFGKLYKTQNIETVPDHTEALNGEPINSIGANGAIDGRIGLYYPRKNIFNIIASADPRTSDAQTSYALMANGESATATESGTLESFGTGKGFIAESGGTPAHYLFDSGAYIDTTVDITMTDTSSFSFPFEFEYNGGILLGAIIGKYVDSELFLCWSW